MSQDEVLKVIQAHPGITRSDLVRLYAFSRSVEKSLMGLQINKKIIADKSNRQKYKYYPI